VIVRCISFLLVLSSVAGISEASSLPAIRDGPPSNGTSISIDGHTLPAVFQTVAYGALMAVGLGEVAAGYRLFRATLFILGGASGGIPTFLLAWDHISDPNAVWIACGLGVMAALLSGVASYFLYKLGVFLCGAALGVVVALIVNMAVLYKLVPGSNVPLIVLAVALGLVFGALGFRYMRLTMVASTSAVGAYAFIRSVGFFAGHYPGNEFDIATELQNGETNLPWQIYAYFASWAALVVIGLAVQLLFTARRRAGEDEDDNERAFKDSADVSDLLRGKLKKKRRSGKGRNKGKGGRRSKKGSAKAEKLLDDYDAAEAPFGNDFEGDAGGAIGEGDFPETSPWARGGAAADEEAAYVASPPASARDEGILLNTWPKEKKSKRPAKSAPSIQW